ncbi:TonB-dependent receptor [uncultured Cyclobacterium sp.]|uniref:SusC/RagA family TonB-linked outer membrane protein n=1 Tax=uncultured Cyclobacterium sp. TaxID=453820 RepID=UPI0030EC86B3|tara:strand:+ start:24392 stop:27493 length:3102 start_codon:yes stop_codon:yes gene_type:complete
MIKRISFLLNEENKKLLGVFLLFFCVLTAPAMEIHSERNSIVSLENAPIKEVLIDIQGKVTDSSGEGVPGATILVKGTTKGTATDSNGDFKIEAQQGDELIVSFVGYKIKTVIVGNQTLINIVLEEDLASLEEVIVVGYGSQEKRNITGAISSLDEKDIKEIPVASAVQAMQGQVAGVDIVSSGGRPGQNPQVLIRGRRSISASNDPLYVIDGIPQTSATSAIFDINPQDITSMEVLKDAAATAIYGSRGANGVIIITTKRGSTGETTVSYDGYYGFSNVTNMVDMMDGQQYAAMKREARRWNPETGQPSWNGVVPTDEQVFLDPTEFESVNLGRSTDWLDLIIGQGSQTNHQISVNGGSDKTQFNISLGYFNEKGIVDNMDYTRATARINLDHKISNIFKVGTSFLASFAIQNWGSGSAIGEAVSNNPLGVPYNEDGSLRFLPTNDGIRTNPLNELEPGAYIDERRSNRIFAPVYVEAKILDGLTFRINAGPDIRYNRIGNFRASKSNANRGGPASASIENEVDFGYTVENILNYSKSFGQKHSFQATFLQSIQGLRSEQHGSEVSNLPYESQLFYDIGTAEVKGNLSSRLEQWSLASYMGRVNYDFMGKYLFQATLRADGSSRLAPGKKWAYFPGGSIGWRLIEESFLSNQDLITELKARISYGQVGNTSVDPYQTLGRLRRTVYALGDIPYLGFGLNEIPNSDLGWEISSTTNFGLDFGLFNNRLSGSFEYYITNTTDILLERNLPYTSGYQNILQNIGATKTNGIEFSLNATPMDKKNFRWDIQFNISSYKEEITDLVFKDENGNSIDDTGNQWFIGQPVRVFFDYEKIGIWQSDEVDMAKQMENKFPGEIKLKDQDGDNLITPDDRLVLGSDVPDYLGGITNRFQIQNFDFSFFFFYRMGHMIRSRFHDSNNNLEARYNNLNVDYWTIDNPSNENPRPNVYQEFPRDSSTRSYFDGSFVKLRNVTLGYNLPTALAGRLAMSRFRIYASAQNPVFWSTFDTWDPELAGDIDAGSIPSARQFLFGVNVTF